MFKKRNPSPEETEKHREALEKYLFSKYQITPKQVKQKLIELSQILGAARHVLYNTQYPAVKKIMAGAIEELERRENLG